MCCIGTQSSPGLPPRPSHGRREDAGSQERDWRRTVDIQCSWLTPPSAQVWSTTGGKASARVPRSWKPLRPQPARSLPLSAHHHRAPSLCPSFCKAFLKIINPEVPLSSPLNTASCSSPHSSPSSVDRCAAEACLGPSTTPGAN